MNIIELAKRAGMVYREFEDEFANSNKDGVCLSSMQAFAALVAAHERKFISEQWEERYGYDKHGVAEFIRKRANTQEEQT